MTIKDVKPVQPLALQISVLAPDFRKDLPVHYPDTPSASTTSKIPISAGYANASELVIVIGLDQGQIIYHYRR
jgi:hypothetical protein